MLAALCFVALTLQDAASARPLPIVDASLDSTGTTLVVTGAKRILTRIDVATGEETARTVLAQSTVAPSAAAPSPGGGTIAILTRDHEVWFWCPDGAQGPRRVSTVPGESLTPIWEQPYGSFVEWSSTGERVLVGVGGRGALLLDAEGEEVARIDPLGEAWTHAPLAWSRDGARFTAIAVGKVVVHDAKTGERLDAEFALASDPTCVALSNNGARLAVGDSQSSVSLFEVETGERLAVTRFDVLLDALPEERFVGCVAFSPDDRLVALTTAPVVAAALIDATNGEFVWRGRGIGGRMGERSLVEWSRDGSEWAHAMSSGVMPTVHRRSDGERVPRPREDPRYPTGLRGFTPLLTAGGRVLHRTRLAIDAFESSSAMDPTWTYQLR